MELPLKHLLETACFMFEESLILWFYLLFVGPGGKWGWFRIVC